MKLFNPSILDDPEAPDEIGLWVAALRSGKYAQGRNALRTENNGFCCLGVYLDVRDPDGWGADPIINEENRCGFPHRHAESHSGGANIFYLDDETRNRLHLSREGMEYLGRLNDGTEAGPSTFAGIADFVETDMKLATARPDRLDPVSWSPASNDR